MVTPAECTVQVAPLLASGAVEWGRDRPYHMRVSTPTLPSDVRQDGFEEALLWANPHDPLVWKGPESWLVGCGPTVQLQATGPDRIDRLRALWKRYVEERTAEGADPAALRAFGSIPFSEHSSEPAELQIPATVLRPGEPHHGAISEAPVPLGPAPRTQLGNEPDAADRFAALVRSLLERLARGDAQKIVAARSVQGTISPTADLRRLLLRLSADYPTCWTFGIDGLLGATPEMLAQVSGRTIVSRVLAGTAGRSTDPGLDRARGQALRHSAKNLAEHAFARDSVRAALDGLCSEVTVPQDTVLLQLPNVWHLASVVQGRLRDGQDALGALRAIHPTAAVAGTPRRAAVRAIEEDEPRDRGRYAGAVGWLSGDGSGEWALALRCAQFSPDGGVRAWAGCGIVPGSDPHDEFQETELKLQPLRDALRASAPAPREV